MPACKDITGQRFGRLVALSPTTRRSGSWIVWECLCDCGQRTAVGIGNLTKGMTQSCGCKQREWSRLWGSRIARDLTGERFGRLVALRPTKKRSRGQVVWRTLCDCGTLAYVPVGSLRASSRAVRSCGCLKDATNFTQHTHINPMDVPFGITKLMKARRELTKALV